MFKQLWLVIIVNKREFLLVKHNKRIKSVNNVFYMSAFTNRYVALFFPVMFYGPFSDSSKRFLTLKTTFSPLSLNSRLIAVTFLMFICYEVHGEQHFYHVLQLTVALKHHQRVLCVKDIKNYRVKAKLVS